MVILVTGGSGFIGSAVVRHLVGETDSSVVNVDKLTYAGHLQSLADAREHPRHRFVQADIADADAMRHVFEHHRPQAVIHLAAESHVDRSIEGPAAFIQTNLVGTATLLEAARAHWETLGGDDRASFRFLHVSTDEVYGSLGPEGRFGEESPYDPSSPYSASKAGADHLVRAWHRTYGLPVLIANCSNNYGPYQFPEKLIPATIRAAADGRTIPVYGDGKNVRDWIYVDDHVSALLTILRSGQVGRCYAVGADSERTNIDVVLGICTLLDELQPDNRFPERASLIRFVADRPGHDWRYAVDSTRLSSELGWAPRESFSAGLRKTVEWYLDHRDWVDQVLGAASSPATTGGIEATSEADPLGRIRARAPVASAGSRRTS